MAGLLDFGDEQGGLFGRLRGASANPLVMMGLGLAGGNGWGEGMQGAMKGLTLADQAALQRQQMQMAMSASQGAQEMLGSPTPSGGAPMSSAPMGGGSPADAIAGIESGGRYDALGPVTKTGDRALGKYQVMGENVGPWTKAVLGQEMSPQEFLANPKAQDAVFQAKFGEYSQKYGPEGAARAWFAGEGGMNNPNARDQLGTSVADYSRKFQMAQNAPPSNPNNPAVQGEIDKISRYLASPQGQYLQPPAVAALKSRLEALQKSQEPTPEMKNFAVDRRPGETMAEYQARAAGMKASAEPTPDIKNYRQYKSEGGKLNFEDWKQSGSVAEAERQVQKEVLGGFTKRLAEGMDSANSAADAIRSSSDLRAQLDAKGGIFSGQWAENKLALAKLSSFLGKDLDPRVTNTETFKSAVGQQVAALVKNFGSGTSITNQDREYAEKMAAGDIKLDETSIRRTFDILEKMNRYKIEHHNEMVGKVAKGAPAGAELLDAYRVDAPAFYKRAEPEPAAPAPGAKLAPDGKYYVPDPSRPGKYLMVQ